MILMEAEKQNISGQVVNHPNNESNYPIHYAALYNNKRVIEILVRAISLGHSTCLARYGCLFQVTLILIFILRVFIAIYLGKYS